MSVTVCTCMYVWCIYSSIVTIDMWMKSFVMIHLFSNLYTLQAYTFIWWVWEGTRCYEIIEWSDLSFSWLCCCLVCTCVVGCHTWYHIFVYLMLIVMVFVYWSVTEIPCIQWNMVNFSHSNTEWLGWFTFNFLQIKQKKSVYKKIIIYSICSLTPSDVQVQTIADATLVFTHLLLFLEWFVYQHNCIQCIYTCTSLNYTIIQLYYVHVYIICSHSFVGYIIIRSTSRVSYILFL